MAHAMWRARVDVPEHQQQVRHLLHYRLSHFQSPSHNWHDTDVCGAQALWLRHPAITHPCPGQSQHFSFKIMPRNDGPLRSEERRQELYKEWGDSAQLPCRTASVTVD